MTRNASGITSLVGVEMDDQRIRLVHMTRQENRVQIRSRYQASLNLNPLNQSPELVGQEILNHWTAAGLREKKCLICLPLRWVLSHFTALPKLSEEDIQSFIRVQAERTFPFSPDDLRIACSRVRSEEGTASGLLAAVLTTRIHTLQSIFKAAKLQPLSMTIGIPVSSPDADEESAVHVWFREDRIQLWITAGGGLAVLREVDAPPEEDDEEDLLPILRDLRVTLGLLPPELRRTVPVLRIYGSGDRVRRMEGHLKEPARRLGLRTHPVVAGTEGGDSALRSDSPDSLGVESAVSGYLRKGLSPIEFLPPQVHRIQQILQRVSSRRNLWMGGTAAVFTASLLFMLLYQNYRLSSLEGEWSRMKDPVAVVESLQAKVRDYRAWFDSGTKSLSIATTLTDGFPAEGTVWVKNLEIQSLSNVTCTGFATDNQDWLQMIDRLRESEQVRELQVQQVQGKEPLQFVFRFRWLEASSHEG